MPATNYINKLIALCKKCGVEVPSTISTDQKLAILLMDKCMTRIDAMVDLADDDEAATIVTLNATIAGLEAQVAALTDTTLDVADAAIATDILIGKSAYANNVLVEGTLDITGLIDTTIAENAAAAADIAVGKQAYVNGVLITGEAV